MLASPGVDLRREDVSSAAHGSSLGFFSADGVPFCITYRTRDRQTDGQTEKHTDTGRDGHTHTHTHTYIDTNQIQLGGGSAGGRANERNKKKKRKRNTHPLCDPP